MWRSYNHGTQVIQSVLRSEYLQSQRVRTHARDRVAQMIGADGVHQHLGRVTPGVPHVFQAYYPILDEAAAALDRAGQLLSAHLASANRVTA